MNVKKSLKDAYSDQYGENSYLFEIHLTITLTNGDIFMDLLYAKEEGNTVLFYQDINGEHFIKIFNKKNISSIEPQYQKREKKKKHIMGYE